MPHSATGAVILSSRAAEVLLGSTAPAAGHCPSAQQGALPLRQEHGVLEEGLPSSVHRALRSSEQPLGFGQARPCRGCSRRMRRNTSRTSACLARCVLSSRRVSRLVKPLQALHPARASTPSRVPFFSWSLCCSRAGIDNAGMLW